MVEKIKIRCRNFRNLSQKIKEFKYNKKFQTVNGQIKLEKTN